MVIMDWRQAKIKFMQFSLTIINSQLSIDNYYQ